MNPVRSSNDPATRIPTFRNLAEFSSALTKSKIAISGSVDSSTVYRALMSCL